VDAGSEVGASGDEDMVALWMGQRWTPVGVFIVDLKQTALPVLVLASP